MMPTRRFLLLLLTCLLLPACTAPTSPASHLPSPIAQPTNQPTSQPTHEPTPTPSSPLPLLSPAPSPLFLAHYMPWYQTPAESGYWGWHWTMDHFNPAETDANGRPEIASHFTPLTGPYDSRDDALLEYQIMLMKLSGIHGVIVDWYGMEDFWDYGTINASTHKLFDHLQRAGMYFAICYEDRTVKNMLDNGHLPADARLPHGREVMAYLQDTWFQSPNYLKYTDPTGETRPVLFVFGNPPYFTRTDWATLFDGLTPAPLLITEDDPLPPAAPFSYPWPPMGLSLGGELTPTALIGYLTAFYHKAENWDYLVAGAFPGFHDIYAEAGVGNSYGYLDAQIGETFRLTLQTALAADPDVIQLITWNDYGEGTNLEPTEEYRYQYLEILQDTHRTLDPAFPFTPDDLTLPLQIYTLRQTADDALNQQLDQVVAAVLGGKLDEARAILRDLEPIK